MDKTLAQTVTTVHGLAKGALDLTAIVVELQTRLFALDDYLREQPFYDPKRYAELYQRRKEKRELTPSQELDDRIRILLRDFEGEPQ